MPANSSPSPALDSRLSRLQGIRLDLGCGEHKQETFVGLDVRPLPGVDIVHDVQDIPWPLPDECCLTVLASHLVEHINPAGGGFLRFMDEAWRVCVVGAQFAISCPYAGSPGYWQDPTHCNGCNQATWAYFDPRQSLYAIYRPRPWHIEHITWNPVGNMEVLLRKVALDDQGEVACE